MMTKEERAARAEARRMERNRAKEQARIDAERNQKPVASLTISIEWKKSRTWGSNPHATAEVSFHDGTFTRRAGYTCSGCGYDKESTVIAQVFDDFLKYKLWSFPLDRLATGKPYGIVAHGPGDGYREGRYYSGGIGTSCYYQISEFIGGTFEHVASGKTFDVYRYSDKEG